MKKILLTALPPSFILFLNTANAQLSQGGTPYSFTHSEAKNTFNISVMPPIDLPALQAQDAINDPNKGPFRFGFNHYVSLNLTNSGSWTTLSNGDRLWRLGIKCPNALTINLAFDDFFMPEGANLFVYNLNQDYVIGAFTNVNNQEDKAFATDLVPGETIVLEYYEPASVANQGKVQLFRVTHGYRGVEDYLEKAFGDAGSCQINVNCPLGSSWRNEKNSVVCLVSGGSEFCTGALINDVPQDGKPYILTANHCGSSGFNTWVFRFNWEAAGCSNPGSSPSTAHSLTGGVQRAQSANSDFSLVEITGGLSGGTVPVTYNPYFSGWSNINTPATSEICIHHPSGDIKKISQSTNPCVSDTWAGTPANSHWRTGTWTSGCTEPGSSGSPLFDQNHHIVGQLHGGPSACGNTGTNMLDYYGKFSMSWLGDGTNATQLKHWLDPSGSNTTGTLDGWGPTVGIAENTSVTSFNIYPNPTDGLFNVEIKLATSETVTINVMNILGEKIESKTLFNISNCSYSFNLCNQSKGMYFVEIATANDRIIKKINVLK